MINEVSVVIPWGKTNGNIKRCVTSAINQTFHVNEILIVVNGLVTIKDVELLKEDLDDRRVKLHMLPGCKNANIARNFGAALAVCKWIAYLDSDDWWDNTHIEQSMARLQETRADFIYSGMRVTDVNGIISELFASDYRDHSGMDNYLLKYLPAQTSSFILKRDCIISQPWDFGLRRHQDYEFISRISKKFAGCHKFQISVNIDWTCPGKHKYHKDCFQFLDQVERFVLRDLYHRHQVNLFKSSIKNFDFVWYQRKMKIINSMSNLLFLRVKKLMPLH